ncbi:MAG: AAA family ATPase [Clostridia bacterium]|nr:AAA family ATPase [Clostridia bacterium]
MGEIIVVTSLKGGVGKTVLSSGLSYRLARSGKRVLAVDMDLGTGGLDIALGREDSVIPTFLDLLGGTVRAEDALFPGDDGVYFLSAPVFFNESSLDQISQENFNSLLDYLKGVFDVVIFDMPADGGAAFRFFEESERVDQILLVSTAAPTSVRAAERCAMRLKNAEKAKLVLNSFRVSKPGDNPFGVIEVIHRTSVPIIGVVPYDSGAEKALAKGLPLSAIPKSAAGKAIGNICLRLTDESVPLLDGVMKKRKRMRFY